MSCEHNDDDELRWEAVGKAADWTDDQGRVVAIGARRIAVFKHQAGWYALKDSCPHANLPIADGAVSGGAVTCPFHGWTFDLATGAGPGDSKVACYPVRERDDGMIEVGV
ncbi:MAG: Rieske (2Fe-2S) protein [Planctomycetota bacterium]|jgi:nitrite reductase/ring-hydroxylating ferredoxin subunit|nr:Rieske (2Fe-2S) protein [Planctomycetota bacterium]